MLIIRLQDTRTDPAGVSLLDGAKLSALHRAVQTGALGVLRPARRRRWPGTPPAGSSRAALSDPSSAHGPWLGYAADPAAVSGGFSPLGPGRCYAAGLKVATAPGDVVWCCDLVTQHEGRLLDPTAGAIRTTEAAALIEALNAACSSPAQRWVLGEGSRHLLVTRREELGDLPARPPRLEPPDAMVGRPWRRHLPRQALGAWLRRVMDNASPVLERHEINKVRVDLGENPANLPWLWGPASSQPVTGFQPSPRWRGVMAGQTLLLRGFASLLGLRWLEAPPAHGEADLQALSLQLRESLTSSDLVYVALQISQTDPVERQCVMDRVDQQLVQPLLDAVHHLGHRALLAVEDAPTGSIPVVLVGRGVAAGPVTRLTAQDAAGAGAAFRDVPGLLRWAASPAPQAATPPISVQPQPT